MPYILEAISKPQFCLFQGRTTGPFLYNGPDQGTASKYPSNLRLSRSPTQASRKWFTPLSGLSFLLQVPRCSSFNSTSKISKPALKSGTILPLVTSSNSKASWNRKWRSYSFVSSKKAATKHVTSKTKVSSFSWRKEGNKKRFICRRVSNQLVSFIVRTS